ncbi:hypothetical protein V6N13_065651 [Hibiscus sabdariffa]
MDNCFSFRHLKIRSKLLFFSPLVPLKQRNLKQEKFKVALNLLVLGPAAYRNPERVAFGLDKTMEFYPRLEKFFDFAHDEKTCKEMASVLAKGNNLSGRWH